jgi:hypothetical protein
MTTSTTCQTSTSTWTTNYAIEHLKHELATFTHRIKNEETGESVEGRKYYDQARYLQYRIGVYRPVPFFEISLSDLSKRMVMELHQSE